MLNAEDRDGKRAVVSGNTSNAPSFSEGFRGMCNGKNCHIEKFLQHVAKGSILTNLIVIAIINSRFLQRPPKQNRGNQLIHRHLSKKKSIGRVSDPEN